MARHTACIENLRQWGVALSLYLPDHDGRIPRRRQGVRPVEMVDRPSDWFNCPPPYSELVMTGWEPRPHDKSIFVCPSAGESKQAQNPQSKIARLPATFPCPGGSTL